MPATSSNAVFPPLISALLTDPACFDHEISPVQLIETHISWVLLTGEFAYKIKKPVNMGFLDFSTLTLRKQACNDEVRLNRRLAPEIYLDVVSICGEVYSPQVNVPGAAIEYAVKMRQFQSDDTMDKLSGRGELGFTQIDALATRIAQFHLGECAVANADSPYGEPDAVFQPVADNFRILDGLLTEPEQLSRLANMQNWSAAEHRRLIPLMLERKLNGKIRECHGDLHLGNLAWSGNKLIIFDCIEFNPDLRWIDVISEVAFCFMDLLHRNHRDLAFRFLNVWLETTGDHQGMALLRYYAVYRAMVRAKVAALRAQQSGQTRDEVNECLLLAEQLVKPASQQLWITHGFSGSGKTTIAQSMLQEHGMVRLRSDIERKRLAGLTASKASGSGVAQGLYTAEASRQTYAHLAKLAENLLEEGWPVIVDATFLARWQRDLFRDLARQRSWAFQILDITSDTDTLRKRIMLRNRQGSDASEADLLVLQHQMKTAESLDTSETNDVMGMSSGSS